MSDSPTDGIPTEALARVAGTLMLAAVAIIHVIDTPGTLAETPLIAYGYFVLIAVALVTAVLLLTTPDRRVWALAAVVAGGAIVAYVLSRTTGLPTDDGDIGNWNCALGIAALCTETLIVALAGWRLRSQQRAISRASVEPAAPLNLAR